MSLNESLKRTLLGLPLALALMQPAHGAYYTCQADNTMPMCHSGGDGDGCTWCCDVSGCYGCGSGDDHAGNGICQQIGG
jgi:hypothetical protein